MTRSDATQALPAPRQLAALGAVLCLYRANAGGELGGWARAASVTREGMVDHDGLRDSLVFLDAHGRRCWQLCLLPDTDFLAWEQLSAHLPTREPGTSIDAGIAERLWRRLAGRVSGEVWQASSLRLHAVPGEPGFASIPLLAASLAPLSSLGVAVARRIARRAGADPVDDCCCRQAAMHATMQPNHAGRSAPVIRFNVRTQA